MVEYSYIAVFFLSTPPDVISNKAVQQAVLLIATHTNDKASIIIIKN